MLSDGGGGALVVLSGGDGIQGYGVGAGTTASSGCNSVAAGRNLPVATPPVMFSRRGVLPVLLFVDQVSVTPKELRFLILPFWIVVRFS